MLQNVAQNRICLGHVIKIVLEQCPMSEYKIRIQILKQKSTLVIFKNSSEQELNSCRVARIPRGMNSTIELSSQLQ